MNPKEIFSRVLKDMLYIFWGGVIGLLLLLAVFYLPKDKMYLHVVQSLPMIEKEFTDGLVVDGYPASLTGNFTDCLMLYYSIYENPEHGILEQVMHMYRGESSTGDGWAPGYSLVDYCYGQGYEREIDYGRYWHGYLILLKPLLMITNVNALRMIMSTTQLLLVGLNVYFATKRNKGYLGLAILLSVPFFYFISMFTSLSLSICYYISMIVILIQLCLHEKIKEKKKYPELFLLAGMATAYFDFLTYPLVTLAFPLVTILYLEYEDWQNKIRKLFGYSIQWGVGYAGLWAMKWILSDVLTGSNVIGDALTTVSSRTGTSSAGNRITGLFSVLIQNIEMYLNWGFYIIVLTLIFWLLYLVFKNRKMYWKREILQQRFIILSVAFYPVAWYLLTQNHSEEHYMFTCKNIAIIVFAVICAVTYKTE